MVILLMSGVDGIRKSPLSGNYVFNQPRLHAAHMSFRGQTVWVFVNGDIQPRRATVMEETEFKGSLKGWCT